MSSWEIKELKELVANNTTLTSISGVGYFFIITIYYIELLLAIIIKNKTKSRKRHRFSFIDLALN